MRIESLVVGPFQENTYIVVDDATKKAVVIDPGDEPERILRLLDTTHATLETIWLTHAHIDHIGGIAGIRRTFDVPILLHPADAVLYNEGAAQAAMFYGIPFDPPPPVDRDLAEGDRLSVGSHSFDVLHLPGHAPGHVVFIGGGVMFGGDVLFAGSIGRTDLPFSDGRAMEASLDRIASLPESTAVHPGHGPSTTIGRELASNPFLSGIARPLRR
jgi:glyoxylase-like metal-dependent hydrolase (beta-lactamase superfamily II)